MAATVTHAADVSVPPSPTATGALAILIAAGDSVSGEGYIIGSDDQGFRLCRATGHAQVLLPGQPTPSRPQCPSLSIAVDGVSGAELPGYMQLGTGVRSTYLIVSGIWSGGTLTIQSMIEAAPPVQTSAALPTACTAPPDEWPGDVPLDVSGEAALRQLTEAIYADPYTYLDYWRVAVDQGEPALGDVTVVGTVSDQAVAEKKLSAIFPYNLCVVTVDFAGAELHAVSRRLTAPDGSWQSVIDLPRDRVVVTLPAVTSDALVEVGGDIDRVILDPLLRPTGSMAPSTALP